MPLKVFQGKLLKGLDSKLVNFVVFKEVKCSFQVGWRAFEHLPHSVPSFHSFTGLPNGGNLEDGHLPSDRRPGRRNRRQKGGAKSNDGKPQPMSSEKEKSEVVQVRSQDDSHGELTMCFILENNLVLCVPSTKSSSSQSLP